jgi:hypothetical protein
MKEPYTAVLEESRFIMANDQARVVSYKKEARTLKIWDGKCCQQPITPEVFSP